MKRRTLIVTALVAATLLGGGALVAQRRERASAEATTAAQAVRAAADAPVEFAPGDVLVLSPTDLAHGIPLTGTLRAVEQATVRSKAAGELRELTVREGMDVKRGQVIARIDPIESEQRLREREAQLASAEAQVAQARREVENNRSLAARGFIANAVVDRSQSQLDVAEAARQAAAAQVNVARKALADTAVVAPIGGVVAERFVQPGEKVSPDNRLLTIVDLSRMEIEAPVPASDIGAVRVGQQVELAIEGIDAKQVGRVARIAPGTAANSRSVPVWIALDNRDPRVRAGMFAQGTLPVDGRRQAIAVPQAAVRDRGGRSFVYAIEDGRVVEKDIVTGLRDDTQAAGATARVEVREGLKAGDRIVAVNLGTLRTGAPATVKAAAPATADSSPAAAIRQ